MRAEDYRLWQLISPALPAGAFQYSQGLENAIERGLVHDEPSAREWIGGVFRRVIASVDLPVLGRAYAAWARGDVDAVMRWSGVAHACRETRELRSEDAHMGGALEDLARSLGEPFPRERLGYVAAFAVLAVNGGIALDTALHGYAWAWCENQVLVAVRTVPLGHLEGQRLLRSLFAGIIEAVGAARLAGDDEIGGTAPGFALASMLHETQHTRLFRS